MKIIESLLDKIKKFAIFLFNHFYAIATELWNAKDGIPFNNLVSDTSATILSSGLMLVFNTLGFVTFLFLPQGKDVLLIVSEDISEFHPESLLWLLFGTLI